MASTYVYSGQQHTSQRGLAMVLALASAVVLSPLYVDKRNDHHHHGHGFFESSRWSSGFVLPMLLAGLIIAIKTASSTQSGSGDVLSASGDPSLVLRIGSSSWGLGAVLILLVLVLSWQHSVQEFFWR